MKKSIEQKTAETILQKSQEIQVGGKVYNVYPPTTATLILVSELVSQMPGFSLNIKNIAFECLGVAKDCKVLGEIAATLILGEGLPKQTRKIKNKGLSGFFGGHTEEVVDPYKELGKTILSSFTPDKLNDLIVNKLLSKMEFASFFALTTSLIEVNLLQATREVVMTASGQ